jgi:DNA-binding response OmpR family regulator
MIKCEDYTILVVDDEEDIREIIAEFLEDEGFNVITAGGGRKAYEITKNHKVSLIVSDINMPDGNGVDLLDSVKSDSAEKPVLLFITGFSDVSVEEAYNRGAEAVFSKPVNIEALIEVIKDRLSPRDRAWSRDHPRLDSSLDIEVEYEKSGTTFTGKTCNIARGGMFVSLNSNFPDIGDCLHFRIKFYNGELQTVEGVCQVRWVRHQSENDMPTGFGAEFLSIKEDTSGSLLQLINSLKTKTFIPIS